MAENVNKTNSDVSPKAINTYDSNNRRQEYDDE